MFSFSFLVNYSIFLLFCFILCLFLLFFLRSSLPKLQCDYFILLLFINGILSLIHLSHHHHHQKLRHNFWRAHKYSGFIGWSFLVFHLWPWGQNIGKNIQIISNNVRKNVYLERVRLKNYFYSRQIKICMQFIGIIQVIKFD